MSILDELLARFPDNAVGAIDADDIRALVTATYEFAAGAEARIQSLELAESAGATSSLTGIWTANPTAGADPSTQNNRYEVTCDTGDFDTATWLRFRRQDKSNTDFTNALLSCQSLYAQQKTDAANWVRYTVNSAVDSGTYIQVNVTVLGDSGGDTGAAAWQEAIVVMERIPA